MVRDTPRIRFALRLALAVGLSRRVTVPACRAVARPRATTTPRDAAARPRAEATPDSARLDRARPRPRRRAARGVIDALASTRPAAGTVSLSVSPLRNAARVALPESTSLTFAAPGVPGVPPPGVGPPGVPAPAIARTSAPPNDGCLPV